MESGKTLRSLLSAIHGGVGDGGSYLGVGVDSRWQGWGNCGRTRLDKLDDAIILQSSFGAQKFRVIFQFLPTYIPKKNGNIYSHIIFCTNL